MGKISGREPRHWHDEHGRHRMPDPRSFEIKRTYWDRDERAYADHLAEHERLVREPEPLPGDPPQVTALLSHIASLEAVIAKERLLVQALRQKAAQTPAADEKGD